MSSIRNNLSSSSSPSQSSGKMLVQMLLSAAVACDAITSTARTSVDAANRLAAVQKTVSPAGSQQKFSKIVDLKKQKTIHTDGTEGMSDYTTDEEQHLSGLFSDLELSRSSSDDAWPDAPFADLSTSEDDGNDVMEPQGPHGKFSSEDKSELDQQFSHIVSLQAQVRRKLARSKFLRNKEQWRKEAFAPTYARDAEVPEEIENSSSRKSQRPFYADAWGVPELLYEPMRVGMKKIGAGAIGQVFIASGRFTAEHGSGQEKHLPDLVIKVNKDPRYLEDVRFEQINNDNLHRKMAAGDYPQAAKDSMQKIMSHYYKSEIRTSIRSTRTQKNIFLTSPYLGDKLHRAAWRLKRARPHDFVQEVANWAYQLIRGMALLEDVGIFHRDIKAHNVMISTNKDGSSKLSLIDFGNANVMTTRHHEAPEYFQLLLDATVDFDEDKLNKMKAFARKKLQEGKNLSVRGFSLEELLTNPMSGLDSVYHRTRRNGERVFDPRAWAKSLYITHSDGSATEEPVVRYDDFAAADPEIFDKHKADVWAAACTLLVALSDESEAFVTTAISAWDWIPGFRDFDFKPERFKNSFFDEKDYQVYEGLPTAFPKWKAKIQSGELLTEFLDDKCILASHHSNDETKPVFEAMKNLLQDMMTYDPKERPSAKKVLAEHFLDESAPLAYIHQNSPDAEHSWFQDMLDGSPMGWDHLIAASYSTKTAGV